MKRVTVYKDKDFIKFVNVTEVIFTDTMVHIKWLASDGNVEPVNVRSSFSIHSITRVDVVEG